MNLEVGKNLIFGKQGEREKEGGIAHTDCGHQIIREDTDLRLRRDRCPCRLLIALTILPGLCFVFLVEIKGYFVLTKIQSNMFGH